MTGWTASPRRRVRPPGPRPDSLARPAGSRSSTSQPRSTLEPPSRLTDDGRRRTWHSIEPVAWAITASGYGASGRGDSQCNQPDLDARGAAMGPPTTRSGARRVCDGQVDPNSMIVAPEVPGDEAGCSPAGGGPNGTRRPSGDSGGSSGHDEQTVVAQVLRRLGSQYALPESELDMAVRAAWPSSTERKSGSSSRFSSNAAYGPGSRSPESAHALDDGEDGAARGEGGWISAGHTAGTAIGG